MTKDNPHIGETLESFLEEGGLATAIKRTIALQIEQEMTTQSITKAEMARRMRTSASQLARLLDPTNDRVQLDTLVRAASAVGRSLNVSLA